MVQLAGSRVPKYRHALHEVYGRLDPAMTAVLCELLLRNVQTAGELRSRDFSWDQINQVVADTYMRLIRQKAALTAR